MADDNFRRVVPLDDAKLAEMVRQKGEMVQKGRAISVEMEELARKHDQKAQQLSLHADQLNELKKHIFKRVEKLARKELGEFEIPITTEIQNGKLVLVVSDALGEFKESFQRFDKWREPVPRKKK